MLKNEEQRRQAIAWAIMLTASAPLQPERYEQLLLEQSAQGHLTLNQLQERLGRQVAHILLRSTASHPFSRMQLLALQQQAQAYNAQHGITGLLCYNQGHFVHLFEGAPTAVSQLFANIRRDSRHRQVACLCDATSPMRWFPDWRLVLALPNPPEFYWIASTPGTGVPSAAGLISTAEPHLPTLLHAFSELGAVKR